MIHNNENKNENEKKNNIYTLPELKEKTFEEERGPWDALFLGEIRESHKRCFLLDIRPTRKSPLLRPLKHENESLNGQDFLKKLKLWGDKFNRHIIVSFQN